jgi:acetyl-CoA C-acetyltransferase
MSDAVIVGAARTAVGTAHKGTLANTPVEELGKVVLEETIRRSRLDPQLIDDVILADPGHVARYAVAELGLFHVGGQSINRYCAGSLTAIGSAAATVQSGMDRAVVAGGAYSASTAPRMTKRKLLTRDEWEAWSPSTHPNSEEAPSPDVSILVGHNTAVEAGLTREDMDRWAFRSHARAVAAIDSGAFVDEIVPIKVSAWDGSVVEFAVDEHPRRGTSLEKLASLKVLHPEIENFQITAGNASGVNDGAAAVMVVSDELARTEGLTPMATIRGWASVGVRPARMGFGALEALRKVLDRSGRKVEDIALWEINEAFASVPVAACREFGIDEEIVNVHGSGCSIGHPISASGGRMINTMIRELQRRGGGLGVASMCAGGGQGGAVLIEV